MRCSGTRATSATGDHGVPEGLGRAADARRDRRGPAAPADLALPRRRGRIQNLLLCQKIY